MQTKSSPASRPWDPAYGEQDVAERTGVGGDYAYGCRCPKPSPYVDPEDYETRCLSCGRRARR